MAHEFRIQREVTFAETDMAGILHFSNYFRYMEEVEHGFFRSLGFSVHGRTAGAWGWARRAASCSYERPLRYQDLVDLRLEVKDKGARSITYRITFELNGDVVARGEMTAVCVARPDDPDGALKAVPMPPEVDAAVSVAPGEPGGSGPRRGPARR